MQALGRCFFHAYPGLIFDVNSQKSNNAIIPSTTVLMHVAYYAWFISAQYSKEKNCFHNFVSQSKIIYIFLLNIQRKNKKNNHIMVVKWVMNAVSYWLQRNSSPKKENCHHLFTLMLFQTHMTSVEHKRRDSKNSSLHVNEMDGNWSLLVKTPHKIIIWVVHTCALHPKSSEAKSFSSKKTENWFECLKFLIFSE